MIAICSFQDKSHSLIHISQKQTTLKKTSTKDYQIFTHIHTDLAIIKQKECLI